MSTTAEVAPAAVSETSSRGRRWRRGAREPESQPGRTSAATEAAPPVSPRVLRLRRACLRAVARARGQPEPSAESCDQAPWDNGLAVAYRSFAKAPSELPVAGPSNEPAVYRPPYGWAAAVALAALLIGLALAPTSAFWETKGHVPPSQVMGIPNAPASPAFVVAARGWTLLLSPFAVSTEVVLTLFALFAGAALAALTFLVVHRTLWKLPVAEELGVQFAVGVSLLGAALFAALGSDVSQRGAWVLHAALLIGAAWLAWRWRDRRIGPGLMASAAGVSLRIASNERTQVTHSIDFSRESMRSPRAWPPPGRGDRMR